MKTNACAYAFLLLAASVPAAPCYSDGDVVTLEGTARRQPARIANNSPKPVWVLALASPICVNIQAAANGQMRPTSVALVQIIDSTPTENVRIRLTGKLVTGNVSGYYAVPTAIWVMREHALPAQ
jgi:hypothetical protein